MAKRIVVFLPRWIGDVVMATPALRALRNHFADASITGVMKPYVSAVLQGTDWLDHSILHDRRSNTPELRTAALMAQLRAESLRRR